MSPKAKQEVPQVIETQKLIIRGPDGAAQVEIAAGDKGPTFLMLDRKGTVRAAIMVEDANAFLGMDSASGHRRVYLGAIDGDADDNSGVAKLNLYGRALDSERLPEPLATIRAYADSSNIALDDVTVYKDAKGEKIGSRPRFEVTAGYEGNDEGVQLTLSDNNLNTFFSVPETAEIIGTRIAADVEEQILAKVREWCGSAPDAADFVCDVFENAMENVVTNIKRERQRGAAA